MLYFQNLPVTSLYFKNQNNNKILVYRCKLYLSQDCKDRRQYSSYRGFNHVFNNHYCTEFSKVFLQQFRSKMCHDSKFFHFFLHLYNFNFYEYYSLREEYRSLYRSFDPLSTPQLSFVFLRALSMAAKEQKSCRYAVSYTSILT